MQLLHFLRSVFGRPGSYIVSNPTAHSFELDYRPATVREWLTGIPRRFVDAVKGK